MKKWTMMATTLFLVFFTSLYAMAGEITITPVGTTTVTVPAGLSTQVTYKAATEVAHMHFSPTPSDFVATLSSPPAGLTATITNNTCATVTHAGCTFDVLLQASKTQGSASLSTQICLSPSQCFSSSPAVVVNVTQAVLQSVKVTPASIHLLVSKSAQLTAMGAYSDGSSLPVTSTAVWRVTPSAIASIGQGQQAGEVTALVAGSATITAAVNNITSPAAALTVAPILQLITVAPANAKIMVDATQPLTATCTFSNGSGKCPAMTWKSSDLSVVTIDSSGLAKGLAAGESNVTVKSPGCVLPACTITPAVLTVMPPTLQSIAITPISASIVAGTTQQFNAACTFSNGVGQCPAITWKSSDLSVATLSASGVAIGVAAGESNITAAANGVTSHAVALMVTSAGYTGISVFAPSATDPAFPSVQVGSTLQFQATGYLNGQGKPVNITNKVVWSTLSSAAKVTATGLVTGVSVGTPSIQATDQSNGASGSIGIAVTAAPVPTLHSIAITPASASVIVGATDQLTATCIFSNGPGTCPAMTWQSQNPAVATINASGVAAGVTAGESNITVKSPGCVAPACTMIPAALTVTPPTLTRISVTYPTAPTGKNPLISVGGHIQALATGTYSDGSTQDITSTVTWSSTSAGIATVTPSGLVTGVGVGNCNIKATLDGIQNPSGNVGVSPAVLQSIAISPATTTYLMAGFKQPFTAICIFSDGEGKCPPLTWAVTSNVTSTGTGCNSIATCKPATFGTAINSAGVLTAGTLPGQGNYVWVTSDSGVSATPVFVLVMDDPPMRRK